nr:type III pantothenate kinase [Halorhodospira abdelmalekii]
MLDLGNSAVKWAYTLDDGLVYGGRCPYEVSVIRDQLRARLPLHHTTQAVHVVGVCVAPREHRLCVEAGVQEALRGLATAVRPQAGGPSLRTQRVEWIEPVREAYGVINGYEAASQLGADRWAALIAARAVAPAGAIVLDVGSAVTVDLLDGAGQHHGGAIFPGVRALQRGLGEAAVALVQDRDVLQVGWEEVLPADNTVDAIAGGLCWGLAAAINEVTEQCIKGVREGHAKSPPVFRYLATGGDLPALRNHLQHAWEVRGGLVLEGVARAAGVAPLRPADYHGQGRWLA